MNNDIQHIDTIIVGAGSAGTTCGYQLVKNGKECLIIERDVFPREKLCGGGLTAKAHKIVNEIYGDIKYEYCKADKIDVFSSHKFMARIYLKDEIRTTVRKDFDNVLHNEYLKIGGKAITDKVNNIEEKDGKIFVYTRSGKTYSCNKIVGADGANSVVRRYLQPQWDKGILCLEGKNFDKPVEAIQLNFHRYKQGYFYEFPNPEGNVVGYGLVQTVTPEEFEKEMEKANTKCDSKIKGAFVPVKINFDYGFHDNIILIGDAGGFIDAMTAEGIYYAIQTGYNAANSIIKNTKFETENARIVYVVKKIDWLAQKFFSKWGQFLFRLACPRKIMNKYLSEKANYYLSKQ